MMGYAPIVIFGYNRLNHIEKTIEALSRNVNVGAFEAFLFLDGNKNDDDKEAVKNVHEYGKNLELQHPFKSLTLNIEEKNQGLAASIIKGVGSIISEYKSVIVLEDDIVTSSDFLMFMNDAIMYYKDIPRIWSISGYSFDLPSLNYIPDDVYLGYRAGSWGWATWYDRWDSVDWEVSDYESFRYNLFQRARFNRGGTNLSDMLDLQMAGEINSWAIRWCYAQYKQDKLTVFPCKSKVINIGQDGSGTHSNNKDRFDANSFGQNNYTFSMPPLNKMLLSEFRQRTGMKMTSRIKRFIKYNIIKGKTND